MTTREAKGSNDAVGGTIESEVVEASRTSGTIDGRPLTTWTGLTALNLRTSLAYCLLTAARRIPKLWKPLSVAVICHSAHRQYLIV